MPLNDFSFLFDDSPNAMWIYELSSLRLLKVNKACIKHYGYSEKELLEMTIRELRPIGEQEKYDAFIKKKDIPNAVNKAFILPGLWKHQTKKGKIIYAELSTHPIIFEDKPARMVVATDATEKMNYQEEALSVKSSLEALINNTEDHIWSVDKDGRYVYMNKAYRGQVAYISGVEPKPRDYSYKHSGYDSQIIDTWRQYYERALNGERYAIINESVDPATGNMLSFEVSFNPIYKTKHEIVGVGCFARNITERLDIEKAMFDQNERLRNIASLTSHELRRPVASMLGLINVMDRVNFFNPDNQEIIEHLLTVGREIDEVIRLIIDKTFIDSYKEIYKFK